MVTDMGDCKKFIADFPVDSAEFFTAITYATSELYISMHVLDLENNTAFPIKTNEFIDKFMKCGSTLQDRKRFNHQEFYDPFNIVGTHEECKCYFRNFSRKNSRLE